MNQYEYQFDVEADGIASRVVRLVGRDKRVLELGCSSGHMSRILVERGCEVVGIERDTDAALIARSVCSQLYEADLDDPHWADVLKDQPKFDAIVAADVLEHLRDPKACLATLRKLLSDHGSLIVSTPNIAHGGVIASLMQGRFQYREIGLLDKTHIHFFTEQSLRDALREQGFIVGHFDSVDAGSDHPEFAQDWNKLLPELREAINRMPSAQAFQFVLSATKQIDSVGASALYETQRQLETSKQLILQLKDEIHLQLANVEQEKQKLIEQSLISAVQIKTIEEQNLAIEKQTQMLVEKNRAIEEKRLMIEKQKEEFEIQKTILKEQVEQDLLKRSDWIEKINRQQDMIDNQDVLIRDQYASIDQKIAVLTQLSLELSNTHQTLHLIVNSSSWRLTAPLRFIARKIPTKPRKFIHTSLHYAYLIGRTLLMNPLGGWKNLPQKNKSIPGSSSEVPRPHFCPPIDDHSVAMPLQYAIEAWDTQPRLAIVCHMYYPDLVEEFANYFLNIPFDFDLYITTNTLEKSVLIDSYFNNWEKGTVNVRVSQNRGRDIAPKLITCRDVYDKYEFVLHVHTKKSPHRGHENGWRNFLLDTLIGSTNTVESVFEAFRLNPRLGMIAPQHLEDIRPYIGWGWNFDIAKQFGERLGIHLSLNGAVDFPSGSMFWARSAALKPLLDIQLSFEDFPEESGQIDGTLGHVIERFYFLAVEKAGFEWMKIALRSMHPQFPERVVDIFSRDELQIFIKQHTRNLSDTYFSETAVNSLSIVDANKPIVLSRGDEALYKRVFKKSEYRHSMDFNHFVEQIYLLKQGGNSEIDFDENFYMEANPDVAEQVRSGMIPCAYSHYCLSGQFEKRLWSDNQLISRFSQTPKLGRGFLAPVNLRSVPIYGPDLSALPVSEEPFLFIFFSHLQDDLFFAGYTEFFKDFQPIFEKFSKILLSVASEEFNPKLATRYSDKINVVQERQIGKLKVRPNLIVSFNSELLLKARDIFGDLQHTIYYCQDFEAGFFPMGSSYARSELAIASSRNLIVSSVLLKTFLQKRELIKQDQKIFLTTPSIEIFPVPVTKNRRIFFYFRPEQFNARNLPELLMETVEQFCKKYSSYELYLLGSVNTCMSYHLNGNSVFIISKLSKKDYVEILSTCDAAVSMIYSAHPGVIAFQTAASGIPTVTNTFENRDADFLQKVSNNIVPFDPVKNCLLERLEFALQMQKGLPSFDRALYEEFETISLNDYVDEVMLS